MPANITLPIGKIANQIYVAIGADVQTEDGTPVGSIEIEYTDGTKTTTQLLYGAHVRAKDDTRATLFGPRQSSYTNLLLQTKPTSVKSLSIRETDLNLGISVYGVTYR
jgi:hypothetical protein